MKCANCGAEVELGNTFCMECGRAIDATRPAKCGNCGTEIATGNAFCMQCGHSLSDKTPVPATQPTTKPAFSATEFLEGQTRNAPWVGLTVLAIVHVIVLAISLSHRRTGQAFGIGIVYSIAFPIVFKLASMFIAVALIVAVVGILAIAANVGGEAGLGAVVGVGLVSLVVLWILVYLGPPILVGVAVGLASEPAAGWIVGIISAIIWAGILRTIPTVIIALISCEIGYKVAIWLTMGYSLTRDIDRAINYASFHSFAAVADTILRFVYILHMPTLLMIWSIILALAYFMLTRSSE